MADLETLIDTHLAGYCEADPEQRRTLLTAAWDADGALIDPPMEATGPDGIAGLVDVVLQHYPGHRFVRTTAVDAHHDHARYGWALVAPDGTAAVTGTDVVTVNDGKLAQIVGFFGEPAPAQS
jgi:hypothetical protein